MGSIKTLISLIVAGVLFFYLMSAYDLTYTGSVITEKNPTTKQLLADPEGVQKDYNANLQNVPNFVKTLLKNEKVNVEIEMLNGSVVKRQLVLREGKLVSVQEGSHAKPDYKVWTTEAVIDHILSAEKPTEEFAQALEQKDITVKAVGTLDSAKLWVGRGFVKVYTFV